MSDSGRKYTAITVDFRHKNTAIPALMDTTLYAILHL